MKHEELLMNVIRACDGIGIFINDDDAHAAQREFISSLRDTCEYLLTDQSTVSGYDCIGQKLSYLTSLLLKSGARRVSGNLVTDMALDMIVHSDNIFARAAVKGRRDDALFFAAENELRAFQIISGLNEEMLLGNNADMSDKNDNASQYALAAWSGTSARKMQKDERAHTRRLPVGNKSCWDYGGFELREPYYSDPMLEELYKSFITSEDWTELSKTLYAFHAQNGSGDFLRYRHFYFDGKLLPMPDLRAGDFVPLMDGEYRLIANNALAFLRGESARPMLLYGRNGMGKTTMMLELTDELLQLRLVYASPTSKPACIVRLLDELRNQPMKFMLLFDDINQASLSGIFEAMLPMNVLVAATGAVPVMPSFFEVSVELPQPQLNEFVRMVDALLAEEGHNITQDAIKRACIDYQVDTKCEFNITSAVRVKELLLS